MATARPLRAMDLYAEQFWAFTRQKELRLQQCSACGKFRWPPGPTCDRRLADDFKWSAISGMARALSWTTFRRGYFEEYPPPYRRRRGRAAHFARGAKRAAAPPVQIQDLARLTA